MNLGVNSHHLFDVVVIVKIISSIYLIHYPRLSIVINFVEVRAYPIDLFMYESTGEVSFLMECVECDFFRCMSFVLLAFFTFMHTRFGFSLCNQY